MSQPTLRGFKPVESNSLTAEAAAALCVFSAKWLEFWGGWKLGNSARCVATPPQRRLCERWCGGWRGADSPALKVKLWWFLHRDMQIHEISHGVRQSVTTRGARFGHGVPFPAPSKPSSGRVRPGPPHLSCAGRGPRGVRSRRLCTPVRARLERGWPADKRP